MKQEALGMIETRGLVSSIEAADAGVKAANVKLLGYEIVRGGLVMVAFTGEVAAVQASVSAGCAAAEKVGMVISRHMIPRPEADLRMVFQGKSAEPDNDPPGSGPSGKGPEGNPGSKGEANSGPQEELDEMAPGQEISPDPEDSLYEGLVPEKDNGNPTGGQEDSAKWLDLESMTVGALRRLARKTPGISIHGREISRANKEQLIKEITRAKTGSNKDSTPPKL